MVMHAELTRATAAQCVTPDHESPLGTINGVKTSLVIPTGGSIESDPAPRDGVAVVTFPAIAVRVRVSVNALATADDQAYIGAYTDYFVVREGERISLFGDGGTGTATIGMAK